MQSGPAKVKPDDLTRVVSHTTRWPNLFIVGAARAGTTSLHDALARHPDVFMSRVKEPHFFSFPTTANAHLGKPISSDAYLSLFAKARTESRLGESSTSYFVLPEAPARIRAASPDAAIIVSLRDPVARAHSHYLHDVARSIERRPFLEALRAEDDQRAREGASYGYIAASMYAASLKRLQTVFDKRQLHVLIFEEFAAEPEQSYGALVEALGLPLAAPREVKHRNEYVHQRIRMPAALLADGPGGERGHPVAQRLRAQARRLLFTRGPRPPIEPEARELLVKHLAGEKASVEGLLGRTIPWPSM